MSRNDYIVIQTIQGVTVATINDSAVIDPRHIEEFRSTLFALIDQEDRRKLVLNLTKVKNLSSAALAVLIPLQEKYAKAKGRLVLVGINDGIRYLFEVTKLDRLLTLADTEAEAITLIAGLK